MDKRFQVFVSSTYADLKEERQKVIQTVMEMDCIPAGRELFPAADEEQWKFVQRVIDDCDYYILIIGGRYGSLTDEGVSYTEKEYDYALSIGLKVLAFVHDKPETIPIGKSEIDSKSRTRLEHFRKKVTEGRLVKMWSEASALPGLVALSLSKTMKVYPAVGWVRATNVVSGELIADLNELRKENSQLRATVSELEIRNFVDHEELASLDDTFSLRLRWTERSRQIERQRVKRVTVTWRQIFARISPDLQTHPSDGAVNYKLGKSLYRLENPSSDTTAKVDHDDFQTVRIQLSALGLITTNYQKSTGGDMALFWSLTKKGHNTMIKLRTVKATKDSE